MFLQEISKFPLFQLVQLERVQNLWIVRTMSFGCNSTALGSMETEFMEFNDIYIILRLKTAWYFLNYFTLRFDTLSIDNEREHARWHSCKDMDVYKRALYRCHMICTKLSFLNFLVCCCNG
ncbi:Uncharacterized protein TCM_002639 [Theobroma cacao]|uniref:Uncharacterized protein n=1 Tax=Theobroma cacao TaxID=3641 RepID=A0A061DMU0_THECC|nr:Uncharacterized protein TCM_002639 [Theobroma cacao]